MSGWDGNRFCEATGKKCYPSASFAKRHAKHVGNRLRAYLCKHCHAYHITDAEKGQRVR